jgi:hypothetical protein
MSEQLNEDMLKPFDRILNSTLKEQKNLDENKIAAAKKKAMKAALPKIYNVESKPKSPAVGNTSINLKNMKSDGHLVEVVVGDAKIKVSTEAFVNMTKGYISELVKGQEAVKQKVHEQEQTIRKLKARLERSESQRSFSARSTQAVKQN